MQLQVLWQTYMDQTVGGVSADVSFVYCVSFQNGLLLVLDKETGAEDRRMTLQGGSFAGVYGSLLVAAPFFYVSSSNQIYRYSLATGMYEQDTAFVAAVVVYNMIFTGQDVCVSQNYRTSYCYRILERSLYDTDRLSEIKAVHPPPMTYTMAISSRNLGAVYMPRLQEYWLVSSGLSFFMEIFLVCSFSFKILLSFSPVGKLGFPLGRCCFC